MNWADESCSGSEVAESSTADEVPPGINGVPNKERTSKVTENSDTKDGVAKVADSTQVDQASKDNGKGLKNGKACSRWINKTAN